MKRTPAGGPRTQGREHMALSSKHPTYDSRFPDWKLMRDSYLGERTIKSKGLEYLPATSLMESRGMTSGRIGFKMYEAYKMRAVYHDIVKPALEAMIGVMHRKPASIEVPPKLEKMLERITFNGEDAQTLLQRINEQQALMGRIGLMLDVATGAKANALPYVVSYSAESATNWDTNKVSDETGERALQFVVLNESGFERTQGLTWNQITRYRVLCMADKCADIFPGIEALGPVYVAGHVKASENIGPADFKKFELAGQNLESIPFVFIGPRDLSPEPDMPQLLSLARIALAIYRGEADYRQSLFMQGQQTLVIKGAQVAPSGAAIDPKTPQTSNVEVGANATIDLPIGGDAKYIGADAGGLKALASAIEDDKRQAAHLGASLLDQKGNAAESGDALQIRSAARTSSLTTMAKAGAEGLRQILRSAAELVGEDPDKVKVEPNLDFGDGEVATLDLVNLMTAKMLGAPISKKTVHWWMSQKDFTPLTLDEELTAIDEEGPDDTGGTPGLAGVPGAKPKPGDPNAPPPKPGDPSAKGPNAKKPLLSTKKPTPKK